MVAICLYILLTLIATGLLVSLPYAIWSDTQVKIAKIKSEQKNKKCKDCGDC
jgi:hypothetical protein